MVASGGLEHVGYEFGGDGCAGFIFLVLPSVRETRNDGSDSSSGGRPTGIDHDEQFHQVVVNTVRTRLYDKYILIPNRFPLQSVFRGVAMTIPMVIAVSQFDVLRTVTFAS